MWRCLVCLDFFLIVPCLLLLVFFFFTQKTAYEMRISDWSSDVCSSDLGKRTPLSLRPSDRGKRSILHLCSVARIYPAAGRFRESRDRPRVPPPAARAAMRRCAPHFLPPGSCGVPTFPGFAKASRRCVGQGWCRWCCASSGRDRKSTRLNSSH